MGIAGLQCIKIVFKKLLLYPSLNIKFRKLSKLRMVGLRIAANLSVSAGKPNVIWKYSI